MKPALTVSDVSTGYGARQVLHGVTLPDIPGGSVVAVIGPNAAGKSTLMKVLAGLLPASGAIRFGDEDLTGLKPARRTKLIGYLPQSLPAGSGLLTYEAVLGACRAAGEAAGEARIEETFRMLDLEDVALRPVNELSGGKRQLVGLAQVLVRNPKVLLLDEPTSALDLRWQIEVLQAIQGAVALTDAVALVSVHDINLAMRFCDAIVVLSNGRVISSGAPEKAISADILRKAWEVEARIEHCSQGTPFVVTDRSIREEKIVPLRDHAAWKPKRTRKKNRETT